MNYRIGSILQSQFLFLTFRSETENLGQKILLYSDNLSKRIYVDIPQKEKYFKSRDYLRKEIREKVKNGIIIRAFWRDIIKDPNKFFVNEFR